MDYDVVVVGGGPAGLSAALILGRALRHTLLVDAGEPRNAASPELRGFLTRDPMPPPVLRQLGREQLERYDTVSLRSDRVTAAQHVKGGFRVALAGGHGCTCRKLLLATGVTDTLPDVDGAARFYGHGVHHCPYCDGWEVRREPLVAFGRGDAARSLALELRGWSDDVTLCSDGPCEVDGAGCERLARHGVRLREERLLRLEGGAELERLVFEGGGMIPCAALFFAETPRQRSPLAVSLGCSLTPRNSVAGDAFGATEVPGLYVAGDASRSVQLAIVAAAEGAEAAFAINSTLLHEDLA